MFYAGSAGIRQGREAMRAGSGELIVKQNATVSPDYAVIGDVTFNRRVGQLDLAEQFARSIRESRPMIARTSTYETQSRISCVSVRLIREQFLWLQGYSRDISRSQIRDAKHN